MPMSTTTRTARIACAASIPHLERGIFEVAELAHQTLGVQRPSLAVTGDEAEQPLEPRQLVGHVHDLRDLQVMARNRFVVAGAHSLPEREAGPAEGAVPRNGLPRREKSPVWPAVHRAGAAGRGDHASHRCSGRAMLETTPSVEAGTSSDR